VAVVLGVVLGVLVAVVVDTIDGDGVVGCIVGVLAGALGDMLGDVGVLDGVGVLASAAGLDAAVTEGDGEGSEDPVDDRSAQPVAVSAASTLRPTANRRADVVGAGSGR
jgi:hypothetical protein